MLDAQEACGISAPVQIIANACASGSNAIGHAFALIRAGKHQRILCGGYDAISELVYVGFDSLQASTAEKIRPFDKARTGLVLGEGAAILALEAWDSAVERGAPILAEVTGYGISTDNHHLTQPHPSGIGPRQAMERALASARCNPEDVDYINAHGTATAFNDATEGTRDRAGFRREDAGEFDQVDDGAFARRGGRDRGGVFSILALQQQFLPPNINFDERDPAWDINVVANEAREARVECVRFQLVRLRWHERLHRSPQSMSTTCRDLWNGLGDSAGRGSGRRLAAAAAGRCRGSEAGGESRDERLHDFVPVPPKLVEQLGRNPRLRRSSAISYFAVAAGLAALEQAGLTMTPEIAARTAVVFAVTDGGVAYTRRFYDQIVKQGANAASPMLFPETVYNAPASHLAAQLGIDGASYTLVGDASTGLAALTLGEQLLDLGEADHVVVVACEEVDWILCEAYRDWRLARRPLAEGAAALVLSREGQFGLEVAGGAPFFQQKQAQGALETSLARIPLEWLGGCDRRLRERDVRGSCRGCCDRGLAIRCDIARTQTAARRDARCGGADAGGAGGRGATRSWFRPRARSRDRAESSGRRSDGFLVIDRLRTPQSQD